MKLKTTLKSLVAAVSMAAAGVAGASVSGLPDSINNVGGSELVLTIFNFGLGVSETYDISSGTNTLGWNDFDGNASYSYSVSGSTLLNQAGTVWNVLAVDNNADPADTLYDANAAHYGMRVMTTFSNANVVDTNIGADAANAGAYIVGINNQAGHAGAGDGQQTGIIGGAGYWGLQMNTAFMPTLGVKAAVGDSMGFLLAADQFSPIDFGGGFIDSNYQGVLQTTFAGNWSLDSQGLLTYSAVPVPAAVWLFGSALVGLVGVARRRAAIA